MKTYEENIISHLQDDVVEVREKDVLYEIKPIADFKKKTGMDPRMLEMAKMKAKKLQSDFSVESFQLHEERYRPDKVNYDLSSNEIVKKQRLLPVDDHYINTFFYKPKECYDNMPVIIYVHGGGFMTGTHLQFENQCKLMAEKCHALVVFPEYRLAPENPFPSGLNDVCGVLDWAYENANELNIDKNKIVMVGDSAGASIINGCVFSGEKEKIKLLFEIYPCVDTDIIGNGIYTWNESYYNILKEEQLYVRSRMNRLKNTSVALREFYYGSSKGTDPKISAIYQEDFTDFPSTVIAIGEYDFLRVSADIFANKLNKFGKLKRAIRYQGCDHGFFDMLGILPQAEDIVLELAKEIDRI